MKKSGKRESGKAETVHWLEICEDAPVGDTNEIRALLKGSRELLAIITTIGRKAKGRTLRFAAVALAAVAFGAGLFLFSLSRFPAFRFSE